MAVVKTDHQPKEKKNSSTAILFSKDELIKVQSFWFLNFLKFDLIRNHILNLWKILLCRGVF